MCVGSLGAVRKTRGRSALRLHSTAICRFGLEKSRFVIGNHSGKPVSTQLTVRFAYTMHINIRVFLYRNRRFPPFPNSHGQERRGCYVTRLAKDRAQEVPTRGELAPQALLRRGTGKIYVNFVDLRHVAPLVFVPCVPCVQTSDTISKSRTTDCQVVARSPLSKYRALSYPEPRLFCQHLGLLYRDVVGNERHVAISGGVSMYSVRGHSFLKSVKKSLHLTATRLRHPRVLCCFWVSTFAVRSVRPLIVRPLFFLPAFVSPNDTCRSSTRWMPPSWNKRSSEVCRGKMAVGKKSKARREKKKKPRTRTKTSEIANRAGCYSTGWCSTFRTREFNGRT